jgi:hypothetical protein
MLLHDIYRRRKLIGSLNQSSSRAVTIFFSPYSCAFCFFSTQTKDTQHRFRVEIVSQRNVEQKAKNYFRFLFVYTYNLSE